jgi:hypothetical protein
MCTQRHVACNQCQQYHHWFKNATMTTHSGDRLYGPVPGCYCQRPMTMLVESRLHVPVHIFATGVFVHEPDWSDNSRSTRYRNTAQHSSSLVPSLGPVQARLSCAPWSLAVGPHASHDLPRVWSFATLPCFAPPLALLLPPPLPLPSPSPPPSCHFHSRPPVTLAATRSFRPSPPPAR